MRVAGDCDVGDTVEPQVDGNEVPVPLEVALEGRAVDVPVLVRDDDVKVPVEGPKALRVSWMSAPDLMSAQTLGESCRSPRRFP